ncbi:MAG: fasciclin domain-containing protein [Candidatus Roseilinea sp.]|uniref:fasciclin domain-containing protein n=1 Tax=Candidatus Roseilinea sp. TaxID=2838777 RepID=UPI0040490E83
MLKSTRAIGALFVSASVLLAACAAPATPAPTPTPAPTNTPMPEPTMAPMPKDIVDTAVAAGSFKTLAAALEAAGLIETLKGPGPFTVFAPTDEAFAKLPAGTVEDLLKPENKDKLIAVLTYHVVPGKLMAADVVKLTEATTVQGGKIAIKVDGGKVMVNDATVTQADIEASNGVIHVIDTVILPPTEMKDIVDTAVAAGSFKTLAAALEAAGLIETLKGPGPFTVFAPTDEAFAKLPAGTVEDLLKPENKDKLIAVLTYHVVPGKLMAADVVKLTEATTVQGGKIAIKVDGGKVMVNDATVTQADIEASNGVIHVIDTVILPPSN